MLAEICNHLGCGQEVRHGVRNGQTGWWHREAVDHNALFGVPSREIDRAEIDRQRHLPRQAFDKDGNPVTYTVAEWERKKMTKRTALTVDVDEAEEEDESTEVEPIEVRSIPLPLKGRVFVGCPDGSVAVAETPGGIRTLLNLAAKVGWTVQRLTYARGPYLGARGSLGVSDTVVLVLDGPGCGGVGSWRDGKSDWAWIVENGQVIGTGATTLKNYMKEHPRG